MDQAASVEDEQVEYEGTTMSLHRGILNDPEARRAYEEELLYGEATDTVLGLLESLQIPKQELARRLQVSPGRVSQILSGRENLTLRTLASLAWALGMHVSLSVEPMTSRAGTPAESDPPAPAWLSRVAPTAGIRFTGLQSALPSAGRLGVRRDDLRLCSNAKTA